MTPTLPRMGPARLADCDSSLELAHEAAAKNGVGEVGASINDRRSAWQMQPDGSYVQRTPKTPEQELGAQEAMIEWAAKELKKATRLRRRQPKGITKRNIRG